ncbi:MAG: hypothetical protein OXP71_09840 [Candidatus Poribacteria bacterium]|nr:hypothetical protein [Candidatus Poribacteria bacterium]
MAEFQRLPSRIRDTVTSEMGADEQIELCLLGRSNFLSPDFVVITSHRLLVLEERSMGSLGASYTNIRCNLVFSEISAVKLSRRWKHRLLRQACVEIDKRNSDRYLINRVSLREAKLALELISTQIQPD